MRITQQCKGLMPTLLRWTEKDVRTGVGRKGATLRVAEGDNRRGKRRPPLPLLRARCRHCY